MTHAIVFLVNTPIKVKLLHWIIKTTNVIHYKMITKD